MKSEQRHSVLRHGAREVGYLSAGPRVSTRHDTELGGPRTHVLGVIHAFEVLGWKVLPYIVGDRIPRKLVEGIEGRMRGSWLVRFGADLLRLAIGVWHSIRCWQELHGKVDWIYERFAVLQALGWTFQLRGVPWILETNGLIFYEAVTERKAIVLQTVARFLEIWAYRRCDVLVCITEELKQLIMEVGGIPGEKILVVPNGVDIAQFNPELHIPRQPAERITIGFVGALVYWHRLDVLLVALSEMVDDFDFNLVIVGDGPMRKTWEEQTAKLGLQSRVRFTGQVPWDEVPAYISSFDLAYLGYSPLEIGKMYGSPVKLYEYMAMARVVISSACADALDMISPGKNGYLFEPADKDDLKRVLLGAYRARKRWPDIGAAARARVIEKASWTSRVQDMIARIERILERRETKTSI